MADHDHEGDEKAEKLPGVAGAVQAVVGSKPVAAMLTPAAEVFGEHLRKRAVEKVAEWEAKRRDNIRKHKERVQQVAGVSFPDDPTEAQAEFAFEWAQRAQHVDPEIHPDLAALWQSLLAEISTNAHDARRFMKALKSLEPEDAVLLLRSQHKVRWLFGSDLRSRSRFQKAGIIDYWWKANRVGTGPEFWILGFLALLFLAAGAFSGVRNGGRLIFLRDEFNSVFEWIGAVSSFDFFLLLSTMISAYSFVSYTFGWYRLTPFGATIRDHGLRYLSAKKNDSSAAPDCKF